MAPAALEHEVHQPVAPLPRSCRACAAGTAGGCCQSLSRPGHAGSGRCVRRAPLRRPQRATHVPRCARASASPLSTTRPPPAAPPARPAAACQPASRPACPPAHRPACLPACLPRWWLASQEGSGVSRTSRGPPRGHQTCIDIDGSKTCGSERPVLTGS